MKITKKRLKQILNESLYSDIVDVFYPDSSDGELKHPIGEGDMYSDPEQHIRLLLALRDLPSLLENARIPEMTEKRPGITEAQSHLYIQLAQLLQKIQ